MSFKVIDGGGPEGRDRVFAEYKFENALRETAANMFRIVRGAGRPHALLSQMSDVLDAAVKLRDLTGQMPMDILSRTLQMTSQQDQILQKRDRGEIDQASIERWESDGTFEELYAEDLIRCGALQFLASEFLGQMTQRSAGDNEMHEGIRELNKMREEKRKRMFGPPRVAKSAKRKPKKKL